METFWNSEEWQYLKQQTIIRDKGMCFICHAKRQLTVHHIKPRNEGGSDSLKNLITLCRSCHDYVEGEDWKFILIRRKEKLEEITSLYKKKAPSKQYLKKYGHKIDSYRLFRDSFIKIGEHWSL